MTTLGMTMGLSAVLVPIGIAGAVLAVICAAVAMVALARGAAGLSGGAVGVWIVGALLSVTASFGNEWMPLAVSGAALAVALVIGGIVRAIFASVVSGRTA